jgi:hypothetical protein
MPDPLRESRMIITQPLYTTPKQSLDTVPNSGAQNHHGSKKTNKPIGLKKSTKPIDTSALNFLDKNIQNLKDFVKSKKIDEEINSYIGFVTDMLKNQCQQFYMSGQNWKN